MVPLQFSAFNVEGTIEHQYYLKERPLMGGSPEPRNMTVCVLLADIGGACEVGIVYSGARAFNPLCFGLRERN